MDNHYPKGTAAFWWLGQMGLLLKIGDTKVCIDYFATDVEGRMTPVPVDPKDLTGIDVFIGSHDHMDHIDHDAWKIWSKNNPQAKFVFPRKHMAAVLEDGVDIGNAVGLNDGESAVIKDVTIHAIAASHEFLDRDDETGLYPYLQYIIEGNEIRLHHAGDTLRYEGMLHKITQFGDIDIQMLPINGRDAKRYRQNWIGNMTWQEAADLAGDTKPALVIPGHWDMFEINGADPNEFADYMDAKYQGRIDCIIPGVMEKNVFEK